MYRLNNHSSNRMAILARQQELLFHVGDLARLWNIQNTNTLYTLLKRYTQKGLLYRVYKGFYSLLPIQKLNPFLLGVKALHRYAYLSTETILAEEGIIAQLGYHVTLVSSESRRFRIGPYAFISRKLKDKFLYNSAGIFEKNGILKATLYRAVADLLYFNSKAYIDGIETINFSKVRELQNEIGYPLTPLSYAASSKRRRRA